MDIKPADGHRNHFVVIATATPKLIVGAGNRNALVFTTDAAIRVGMSSGTLSTEGMIVPANQGFTDNYSTDEWWVIASSGSGTVSGFTV